MGARKKPFMIPPKAKLADMKVPICASAKPTDFRKTSKCFE